MLTFFCMRAALPRRETSSERLQSAHQRPLFPPSSLPKASLVLPGVRRYPPTHPRALLCPSPDLMAAIYLILAIVGNAISFGRKEQRKEKKDRKRKQQGVEKPPNVVRFYSSTLLLSAYCNICSHMWHPGYGQLMLTARESLHTVVSAHVCVLVVYTRRRTHASAYRDRRNTWMP